MPNWNQLRPSKKHDSPPSSSSTVFTDSLNGSDTEDDFAPLISLQEQPDEKLDVEDQGGSRQLGRRRSLIRNAGDSLSKRWGLGGGGGFSDANDDGPLLPTRTPSLALRGNKSPTFTLPRTRFSLTRRTISSRDMVKSGGGTKNQTSPTKKKRSYLLKRCDLPEVKERKESVASSLQKYLDIDDDEEPEVPARPENTLGDASEAKNNGSLTSISFMSPKKKKDKAKKTKKKESSSSESTSKNTATSVFGSWGEKSWGEKSWGNISWGNTSNTDVTSNPSEKRKKKKSRGDNKKRHSSSKKQSPQTSRRPPRSPHSMTKRVPPPSPRIFPSSQVRGVQLNFDGMNSRSELPHMPAIESPLNA